MYKLNSIEIIVTVIYLFILNVSTTLARKVFLLRLVQSISIDIKNTVSIGTYLISSTYIPPALRSDNETFLEKSFVRLARSKVIYF